jgi:hypothetical protein
MTTLKMTENKVMENVNDVFERIAEQFYEDFGLLAPGKSCPSTYTQEDDDRRNELFKVWIKGYNRGQSEISKLKGCR